VTGTKLRMLRTIRRALDTSVGYLRSTVPPQQPTVVSFTFDDGWVSQYDIAYPLLQAHGMQGTFFVNSNLIGKDGRLTWSHLEELAAAGHEIGGHTLDHPDLTAVSPDEARRQIREDRQALIRHGFEARSFAYPGGAYDTVLARIVRECGYAAGRAAYGLRNLDQPREDRRPLAERIPPSNPYAILTPCCIWSTTALSRLVAYVTTAERRGGGWVVLVLHRVCDGCGGEEPAPSISSSTLSAFLDWLEARRNIGTAVRTLGEVVAEQTG
jgi:peptidoglycan/xylan/chitin deacetylase (PgdA/CDA1 family)